MTTTRLVRTFSAAALLISALSTVGCTSGGSSSGCDTCGGSGGRSGAGGNDQSLQDRYFSCVDPCWPERYSYQARQLTLSPFANHVANGHILDQTMQNVDFDAGTDKLNPGGLQKLDSLARRRPVDGHIFLQTTRDISYDGAKAQDYVKTRADLDGRRVAALTAYLNASTSGRANAPSFDVTIIDPADMTINAAGPASSIRGYPGRFASGIGGLIQVNTGSTGGTNPTSNATGGSGGQFNPGQGGQGGNQGGTGGNPGGTGGAGGSGNPTGRQ